MAGLIEPQRGNGGNGSGFILYTTEEGGQFHVIKGDRDDYERVVEAGTVSIRMFEDMDAIVVEPVYVAYLCVVETNYDTVLGSEREAA